MSIAFLIIQKYCGDWAQNWRPISRIQDEIFDELYLQLYSRFGLQFWNGLRVLIALNEEAKEGKRLENIQ